MSGDEIYMDYYSRLGPIDPQIPTAKGNRLVPALGYLKKWEELLQKEREGKLTQAELHLMIDGFDQAELYQYQQARELSVSLLRQWLVKYKFKNWKRTQTRKITVTAAMKTRRAVAIAQKLNNTDKWHSHGYGISMEVLRRDINLLIDDLEDDPERGKAVRQYDSLLSDYMAKLGHRGALHTVDGYRDFM